MFELRCLMGLLQPPGSRHKREISQLALPLKLYDKAVRVCISGCHRGNMSGAFGLLTKENTKLQSAWRRDFLPAASRTKYKQNRYHIFSGCKT
jgi:hypothetical protein